VPAANSAPNAVLLFEKTLMDNYLTIMGAVVLLFKFSFFLSFISDSFQHFLVVNFSSYSYYRHNSNAFSSKNENHSQHKRGKTMYKYV